MKRKLADKKYFFNFAFSIQCCVALCFTEKVALSPVVRIRPTFYTTIEYHAVFRRIHSLLSFSLQRPYGCGNYIKFYRHC